MTADVIKILQENFSGEILSVEDNFGKTSVIVRKNSLHSILEFLKKDARASFEMLIDICGIDYLHLNKSAPQTPRYEIVYQLYSLSLNHRLCVRAQVTAEDMLLRTATDLWPAANWSEREAAEMFGFVFEGHPNPKNLLLYQDFPGHPLRKDYAMDKRHAIPVPLEKL